MERRILRKAGPNEKRCIVRHSLHYYSNIAVGAIYLFPRTLISWSRLQQPNFYVYALKECILQHPFLSATIQNAETNDPVYTKPDQLDLQQHIRILDHQNPQLCQSAERERISGVLEQLHNSLSSRFSHVDSRPAWAIDVVMLSTEQASGEHHRVFVSFTYSHSHGDGMSGIAFHRTFHEALQNCHLANQCLMDMTIESSPLPLPEQADTSSNMPISLSYLLRPALGTYLPRFLTRLFGLTGNVSGADAQSWVGSKTFVDEHTPGMEVTTSIETCSIMPKQLVGVLALCKKHKVKLTALLNYIIGQALRETMIDLNESTEAYTNLISTIPVNLRKALEVDVNTIGNYGGAAYVRYDLETLAAPLDEQVWALLQTQGKQLVLVASNTSDQPIGLLRFVSNFVSWIQGQIGQQRDCSWELSNLGSFEPVALQLADPGNANIGIEQIMFSQPACPFGPPIVFNAVAVKNSALNIAISWQAGALGLSSIITGQNNTRAQRDREFIQQLATTINIKVEQLVQNS